MHRFGAVFFAVRPRIEPGASRGTKATKITASTSPLPRHMVQHMRQADNPPPAPSLHSRDRRLNFVT